MPRYEVIGSIGATLRAIVEAENADDAVRLASEVTRVYKTVGMNTIRVDTKSPIRMRVSEPDAEWERANEIPLQSEVIAPAVVDNWVEYDSSRRHCGICGRLDCGNVGGPGYYCIQGGT